MWKGLADLNFKKIDGGYVFFPYGILADGYHVDEGKKAELGAFISRFYFIWIPVTLVLCVVLVWWVSIPVWSIMAAALILPMLAHWYFGINRRLEGVARSNERLTLTDSQRAMAQAMPRWLIYLVLACAVLTTAGSVFVVLIGVVRIVQQNSGLDALLIGAFGILFFGAGLLMAINLIRLKRSAVR